MNSFLRSATFTLVITGVLAVAAASTASTWCGENGVIRFSFDQDDTTSTTLQVEPDDQGVTRVTVRVWLTDVDPVALDGVSCEAIGGYEFKLLIEGAEVFITNVALPEDAMNLVGKHLTYVVGLRKSLGINDGKVLLGTWQLAFQGQPSNVRLGIAPEGVMSCADMSGCHESGTRALYIGSSEAGQLEMIFGAGCQPAWINPTGDVATTAERGASTWQDVGLAETAGSSTWH
ncbi:hypothetical protein DRQ50_02190 [bacterium]|nr:MAG: hypothetical protein DRQ50_02190 [bacterium]